MDHIHENPKQPRVSVIVPVYNVEKYLTECLDSICNQTLKDIEIICVDDGATDSSPSILAQYAKKDSRIHILHQENQGLSVARNTGAARACGRYLYFCDSDDYLEQDALEYLYEIADRYDAQLIFFNHEPFGDGDVDQQRVREAKKYAFRWGGCSTVCTGAEMMLQMLRNGGWIVTAWGSMVQRNYFEKQQLQFPAGILYEDNFYTFHATLLADRVCYAPKILYHYRIRQGSIMTAHHTWQNVNSYFSTILEMVKILNRTEPSKEHQEIAERIFTPLIWHLRKSYAEFKKEGISEDVPQGARVLIECWEKGERGHKTTRVNHVLSHVKQDAIQKCVCAKNKQEASILLHSIGHQMSASDVVAIESAPSLWGTMLDGHVVCSPETALNSGYTFVIGQEAPAWLAGQDVISVEEFV